MHPTDVNLLTSAQVAEMLGKDVSTVTRMVHQGRLTPVQKLPGIRGAFLFQRADVAELMSEHAA